MGMNREQWPDDWADRRRLFLLDRRAIEVLLREGTTVRVMRGIPAGAHVVAVGEDFARDVFVVAVVHPSFAPVLPGLEPPVELVALEQIHG